MNITPLHKNVLVAENKRAERILFMINAHHETLTQVYEQLVDREFETIELKLRVMIRDFKDIINSIPDDDF